MFVVSLMVAVSISSALAVIDNVFVVDVTARERCAARQRIGIALQQTRSVALTGRSRRLPTLLRFSCKVGCLMCELRSAGLSRFAAFEAVLAPKFEADVEVSFEFRSASGEVELQHTEHYAPYMFPPNTPFERCPADRRFARDFAASGATLVVRALNESKTFQMPSWTLATLPRANATEQESDSGREQSASSPPVTFGSSHAAPKEAETNSFPIWIAIVLTVAAVGFAVTVAAIVAMQNKRKFDQA